MAVRSKYNARFQQKWWFHRVRLKWQCLGVGHDVSAAVARVGGVRGGSAHMPRLLVEHVLCSGSNEIHAFHIPPLPFEQSRRLTSNR